MARQLTPRQLTPRQRRLRDWLRAHDITIAALGRALGVSSSRAGELLVAETMPTWLYARCFSLGLPADLLPEPLDRKRGPKPKIPRFPGRQETILPQRREKSPATAEGGFA